MELLRLISIDVNGVRFANELFSKVPNYFRVFLYKIKPKMSYQTNISICPQIRDFVGSRV